MSYTLELHWMVWMTHEIKKVIRMIESHRESSLIQFIFYGQFLKLKYATNRDYAFNIIRKLYLEEALELKHLKYTCVFLIFNLHRILFCELWAGLGVYEMMSTFLMW